MKKLQTLTLRLLAVAIMASVSLSLAASFYDFEVDGIYYKKNSDNVSVNVSKESSNFVYTGEITIPTTVTYDGTEYAVTGLQRDALHNATITGITIDASLPNISAFKTCKQLKKVVFTGDGSNMNTRRMFAECSTLETLVLPKNLKTIGYQMCWNCYHLKPITIPETVTEIGEMAFCNAGIYNYNAAIYNTEPFDVELPLGLETIGHEAFYGCKIDNIYIPAKVTSIGTGAFSGLEWITVDPYNPYYEVKGNALIDKRTNTLMFGTPTTKIPAGVKRIEQYAFSQMQQPTPMQIDIPEGVTEIGYYAFGESRYNKITLPSTLETIEYAAFRSTLISEITIPASVKNVKGHLFDDCRYLKTVIVDPANPLYDSRDNCNAVIETATNTLVAGSLTTVIPNTVTKIGYMALAHLAFENIVVPNSVTEVDGYVFCNWVTSSNMKTITLGSGLKKIREGNFQSYKSIETIECLALTPPECTEPQYVFNQTIFDNTKLRVPEGCGESYRTTAPWSSFKNIEEIAGVDDIIADDTAGEVRYYDLQGRPVDGDNLTPGIYVRIEGTRSSKIAVR